MSFEFSRIQFSQKTLCFDFLRPVFGSLFSGRRLLPLDRHALSTRHKGANGNAWLLVYSTEWGPKISSGKLSETGELALTVSAANRSAASIPSRDNPGWASRILVDRCAPGQVLKERVHCKASPGNNGLARHHLGIGHNQFFSQNHFLCQGRREINMRRLSEISYKVVRQNLDHTAAHFDAVVSPAPLPPVTEATALRGQQMEQGIPITILP